MVKDLSYKQTRMEIRKIIMSCLQAAEKQKRTIDFKKLNAQIELDYGVGQLAIKRIIENLETLGFIRYDGNTLRLVPGKSSE